MSALLPPPDADKLAKVCGLLSSDHDGERAAAAFRATAILRAAGLTWRQLVERACAGPPAAPTVATGEGNDDLPVPWTEAVWACERTTWRLTEWELQFIRSIRTRPRISAKQRQVLARIYAKITAEDDE